MGTAVCTIEELKISKTKAVKVNNRSIVLILSESDEVHALRNVCPHKGAQLSLGFLDKTCSHDGVGEYNLEKDNQVLRCPWHSWEFDIRTGCSSFDPERVKVRTYEVYVEEGIVYINI